MNESGYSLRTATMADVPALHELIEASVRELGAGSYTPARIRAFFVRPAHARRGLGRRLYQACAAAASARGFTALELTATMPGVPLYAALGFERLESVVVPTAGGIALPCVRMRRAIAGA